MTVSKEKSIMVLIWRIETGDGKGAYRGGLCYLGNNEVAYGGADHPSQTSCKDVWRGFLDNT